MGMTYHIAPRWARVWLFVIIGSRINWSRLSLIVIGGQSLPSGGFNSVQLQAELGKLRWLRKENRQRHSSKVKRPRYCYYCLQKLRTIHQFSPFLETPLAYTRGSIPYRQALWMHCTLVQIKDTFLGMYHGWTYSRTRWLWGSFGVLPRVGRCIRATQIMRLMLILMKTEYCTTLHRIMP